VEVPFTAPAPGAPGSMDVMVSLDAAGRIDAFHVLRADQALAAAAAKLVGLRVHEPVSGHEVPRLVRRARVTCATDAACRVVLQPVVAPGESPMLVR
jgi:hypothetical protein